ncbi:MAG: hypothetical protein WBA40_27465 [Roseiarcus sp.]
MNDEGDRDEEQVSTVLIAMVVLPTTLCAKEQILCSHTGRLNVVITLGASKQFGRILNCISGDFIVDMTPCAPDGGYGLSAGTGSAPLVSIVDRWQDYATPHWRHSQYFHQRPQHFFFRRLQLSRK